jgi:hypothetical protein
MSNKPTSITIIGTLAILVGAWFIFFDVINAFHPLITSFNLNAVVDTSDYGSAIKVILTALFIGSIKNILLIISGIGLLKLNKWSIFLLAITSIYNLLVLFFIPLFRFIVSKQSGVVTIPPTPLLFMLFLWPLFSRKIRGQVSTLDKNRKIRGQVSTLDKKEKTRGQVSTIQLEKKKRRMT